MKGRTPFGVAWTKSLSTSNRPQSSPFAYTSAASHSCSVGLLTMRTASPMNGRCLPRWRNHCRQDRPGEGRRLPLLASPCEGWSYIQKVNKVSVTVLDNWNNGGANFTRTMPFDKLTAVMNAADVQAKRKAGLLIESADASASFSGQRRQKSRRSKTPKPHCAVSGTRRVSPKSGRTSLSPTRPRRRSQGRRLALHPWAARSTGPPDGAYIPVYECAEIKP